MFYPLFPFRFVVFIICLLAGLKHPAELFFAFFRDSYGMLLIPSHSYVAWVYIGLSANGHSPAILTAPAILHD